MGKWPFSIAMLNYQRVFHFLHSCSWPKNARSLATNPSKHVHTKKAEAPLPRNSFVSWAIML